MWICLNDAFFSIVESPQDKDVLVVRARFEGDIEKVFTSNRNKVIVTPARDYRFRSFIDRDIVADVISNEVKRIDYGNFKDSVHNTIRKDAYTRVWCDMYAAQEKMYPETSWLNYRDYK